MATVFNMKWPNTSSQNEIKLAQQPDSEPVSESENEPVNE